MSVFSHLTQLCWRFGWVSGRERSLSWWEEKKNNVDCQQETCVKVGGFLSNYPRYVYCSPSRYSWAISCPSANFQTTEQFHSLSPSPSLSATVAHVQQRRVPPPSITLRLAQRRMLIKTGKWPFGPGDEARSVSAAFWDWLALSPKSCWGTLNVTERADRAGLWSAL